MKIIHTDSVKKYLPQIILLFSLSGLYLYTLAPGLTWANGGSDGGDLITAAATGGVPHPTGYPLYLLLARLFQFLPFGSLAFRMNLLSAVATVFAAVLIYMLVQDLSTGLANEHHWPAALAAGFAVGLAPLLWSQAVITEVYGLQAFLVALILYLYLRRTPTTVYAQKRLDCWRGLVLGLAMGNHVTTLLLIPVALFVGSIHFQEEKGEDKFEKFRLNWEALVRQSGMFALGLCIYFIIPLRAATNPPVNWGNVISLERFWWLVSGQLYQSYYLQFDWMEIWSRVQAWAALLLEQFGLPGVTLGLVSLILFGERSRLFILTVWTAAVFSIFAIVYGAVDSDVYLIPMFLSFAIWIGAGIERLAAQSARPDLLKILISLLMLAFIAGRSIGYAQQVDASKDLRAEEFGEEVLSAAPPNAILFAKGDQAVFTLWYFHFALGRRPDLTVIASDLLHFDWYEETLQATYPSLMVPTPYPWPETIIGANPSRPACTVQYLDVTEINCASDAP